MGVQTNTGLSVVLESYHARAHHGLIVSVTPVVSRVVGLMHLFVTHLSVGLNRGLHRIIVHAAMSKQR